MGKKIIWFDWHSYNSGFYCILAFSSTVGVITFSLITLKVLYLRGTPAILYCTTISLGHLQATYLKKNDLNWYSTGWDILFFKKKEKKWPWWHHQGHFFLFSQAEQYCSWQVNWTSVELPFMFSLHFNDSTDVSRVEKMATIFGVCWGLRGHPLKQTCLILVAYFGG